jgi:2-phospho-L-lactate guanylyltransferase
MTTIVVPFSGPNGKTRLHASQCIRRSLALAMLGDVVAACVAVGETTVVTADPDAAELVAGLGATTADDPGGGQGAAVAAAIAHLGARPLLIVNADIPCAVPEDLHELLAATPPGGMALVEAPDGTTNALSLPSPGAFAQLYGRDSADRFRAHGRGLGLEAVAAAIPNLADDVDTLDDLCRLAPRAGARTQAELNRLRDEVTV